MTAILTLIIFVVFITIINDIIQLLWIQPYYYFGIKLYEEEIPTRSEKIVDLYTRLEKEKPSKGKIKVGFHLSRDSKTIYFRKNFLFLDDRWNTIMYGRICEESGLFIIIGYLGILDLLLFTIPILFLLSAVIAGSFTEARDEIIVVIIIISMLSYFIISFRLNINKTTRYFDSLTSREHR
jgi:hypothetical protein